VNDGVESRDACPSVVGDIQGKHVSLGIQFPASTGGRAALVPKIDRCRQPERRARKISRYMAGTTTDVADRTGIANTRCKSIKKLSVEWFVLQFVEDPAHVFVGHAIVATLSVHVPRLGVA
jgi:hypothetical protein